MLGPIDMLLAASLFATYLLLRFVLDSLPARPRPGPPRLMLIETGATLHVMRERRLESTIAAADLGGFFDHVTIVHPLVGADPTEPADNAVGPASIVRLDGRHDIVEAPVGRLRWMRVLPRTNFVIAQAALLRALHGIVRRRRIKAVRVGEPYYQALLALSLRRRHGIPIVVRLGGNDDESFARTGRRAYPRLFPSRGAEKWIARRVLARVDLVAGANQNSLSFARANGARPDRLALFPYGNLVDPVHFAEPAGRAGADEARRTIGLGGKRLLFYVGRLEATKYAGDLIPMIKRVAAEIPDAALVVVGDGTLRDSLENATKKLGITENVAFMGSRDQPWIASALANASVIVSPHMGRALVECALAGAPIIAYDVDWQAEFVEPGVNGFLVPARDETAMAEHVVRLLRNEDLRRRLGAQARARAQQKMDPRTLEDAERVVYAGLLARATGQ